MAKVTLPVLDKTGAEVKTISLKPEVFAVAENKTVMQDAVLVYQANMRQDTAKTKKRFEVSGGGKKPWRQKGTGRARAGSTRSPIWVGGGTVFGPTGVQNHKLSQNKKEHALALKCGWSMMAKNGLVVLDDMKMEAIKTKDFANILKAIKCTKKTLVVMSEADENVVYSASNIKDVYVAMADNVSVYDLMYFDNIVTDEKTIKMIEEALA